MKNSNNQGLSSDVSTHKSRRKNKPSFITFDEFCLKVLSNHQEFESSWSRKKTDLGTKTASLKQNVKIDFWTDEFLESSLSLIEALKAENKPHELFVVCSFLVLSTLELFYKCLLCPVANSLQEQHHKSLLTTNDLHRSGNVLEEFWAIQIAMLEQRRSNVQLISQAIEYADALLHFWSEGHGATKNKKGSYAAFLHHFVCSIDFVDKFLSPTLLKNTIIFLIGIRHLLLFGLYPVLSAPVPGTQNPTPSNDPALLSIERALQLKTDRVVWRFPPIVLLWLRCEEVLELDDALNKQVGLLKIPSFKTNVLSPLYKMWNRCSQLSRDNKEWRERAIASWRLWNYALVESLVFYSSSSLNNATCNYRCEKLKQLVELIYQVVQASSSQSCHVTHNQEFMESDVQYLLNKITGCMDPAISMPVLLFPLLSTPLLTSPICQWLGAIFRLLKIFPLTPASTKSIKFDAETLYCQITDWLVSKTVIRNLLLDSSDVVYSYLCLLSPLIEIAIGQFNFLLDALPNTKQTINENCRMNEVIFCNIFSSLKSPEHLRLSLLKSISSFQRIELVISVLKELKPSQFVALMVEVEDIDGIKTNSPIATVLCGRLRRRIINLSHVIYQLLSKMKRKIIGSKCEITSPSYSRETCDNIIQINSFLKDLVESDAQEFCFCRASQLSSMELSKIDDISSLLSLMFKSSLTILQQLINLCLTGNSARMTSNSEAQFLCIDELISSICNFSNCSEVPLVTPRNKKPSATPTGDPLVRWVDFICRAYLNLSGIYSYSIFVLSWCNGRPLCLSDDLYLDVRSFLNALGKFCEAQLKIDDKGQQRKSDINAIAQLYIDVSDMYSYLSSQLSALLSSSSLTTVNSPDELVFIGIEALGLLASRWSLTILQFSRKPYPIKSDFVECFLNTIDVASFVTQMSTKMLQHYTDQINSKLYESIETIMPETDTAAFFTLPRSKLQYEDSQGEESSCFTNQMINESEVLKTFFRRASRLGRSIERWKEANSKIICDKSIDKHEEVKSNLEIFITFIQSLSLTGSVTLLSVLADVVMNLPGSATELEFYKTQEFDLNKTSGNNLTSAYNKTPAYHKCAWTALQSRKPTDNGHEPNHTATLQESLIEFLWLYTRRLVKSEAVLADSNTLFSIELIAPFPHRFILFLTFSLIVYDYLKVHVINQLSRMHLVCELNVQYTLFPILSVFFEIKVKLLSMYLSSSCNNRFDADVRIFSLRQLDDWISSNDSPSQAEFNDSIFRSLPRFWLPTVIDYISIKYFNLISLWKRTPIKNNNKLQESFCDVRIEIQKTAIILESLVNLIWNSSVACNCNLVDQPSRFTRLISSSIVLLIRGLVLNLDDVEEARKEENKDNGKNKTKNLYNEKNNNSQILDILSCFHTSLCDKNSREYSIIMEHFQKFVSRSILQCEYPFIRLENCVRGASKTTAKIILWMKRLSFLLLNCLFLNNSDSDNVLLLNKYEDMNNYSAYEAILSILRNKLEYEATKDSSSDVMLNPTPNDLSEYIVITQFTMDVLSLTSWPDFFPASHFNFGNVKAYNNLESQEICAVNKGSISTVHSIIDFKYSSLIFTMMHLILLYRSLPSPKMNPKISMTSSDISGLGFLAKAWYQCSSQVIDLEKQKQRCGFDSPPSTLQFVAYSENAISKGDSSFSTFRQHIESFFPLNCDSGDANYDEVKSAIRNNSITVTPRRTEGKAITVKNNDESKGVEELRRLLGDALIEKLRALETLGRKAEFEDEIKKLQIMLLANRNPFYFGTSTAIQFAIIMSKFHCWATGDIHLSLLAASEAVAECNLLLRTIERETSCNNNGESKLKTKAKNQMNPLLKSNDDQVTNFADLQCKNQVTTVVEQSDELTYWNIDRSLNTINFLFKGHGFKQHRSEYMTSFRTPLGRSHIDDCCGTLLSVHDFCNSNYLTRQNNRSRCLFHVMSLLIQSCFLLSTLYSSIGEINRGLTTCLNAFNTVLPRIRFPFLAVVTLVYCLANKIRKVSFKQLISCTDDKAESVYNFMNVDEIADKDATPNSDDQKQIVLLDSCFLLARILSFNLNDYDISTIINQSLANKYVSILWPLNHPIYASVTWLFNHYRADSSTDKIQSLSNNKSLLHNCNFQNIHHSGYLMMDIVKELIEELANFSDNATIVKQFSLENRMLSNLPAIINSIGCVSLLLEDCVECLRQLIDLLQLLLKEGNSRKGFIGCLQNNKKGGNKNSIGDELETEFDHCIQIINVFLLCLIGMKLSQAFLNSLLTKTFSSLAIDCIDRLLCKQTLEPVFNRTCLESIRTSVIIIRYRHTRCYWLFRFRHQQKLVDQTVEDSIRFLLRNYITSQEKEIQRGSPQDNDKPDSKDKSIYFFTDNRYGAHWIERIPELWTIIYLEVQTKENYKRLRCWRYFGSRILDVIQSDGESQQTKLNIFPKIKGAKFNRLPTMAKTSVDDLKKKHFSKDTSSGTNTLQALQKNTINYQVQDIQCGCWVSVSTDWIHQEKWELLDKEIETFEMKNITTAKYVTSEVSEWWRLRSLVDESLMKWKDNLENSYLSPILPWMCGWCAVSGLVQLPDLHKKSFSFLTEVIYHVDRWISEVNDGKVVNKSSIMKIHSPSVETICQIHLIISLDLRLRLLVLLLGISHHYLANPSFDVALLNANPDTHIILKHYFACFKLIVENSLAFANYNLNQTGLQKTEILQICLILWNSFCSTPVMSISTKLESSLSTGTINKKKMVDKIDPPRSSNRRKADLRKQLSKLNLSIECLDFTSQSSLGRHGSVYPVILFACSNDLRSYQIPWDSLSLLQEQNISLGVDLQLFVFIYHAWILNNKALDPFTAKYFFIVNPSGDLSQCNKTIPQQMLNSHLSNGFFDAQPDISQTLRHLATSDVYIYCGHGGGTQFLTSESIQMGHIDPKDPETLRGTKIKPIVFLLGCGSVRPMQSTNEEVDSLAIDFLVGGSPSVFGLLWAVTDKDLNRFTFRWFSNWLDKRLPIPPQSSSENNIADFQIDYNKWGSLIRAKKDARPECCLQHITGSACIALGLPF